MELEVWLHLYCYWVGNYLVSIIRFIPVQNFEVVMLFAFGLILFHWEMFK